jgi:hypothetical protein
MRIVQIRPDGLRPASSSSAPFFSKFLPTRPIRTQRAVEHTLAQCGATQTRRKRLQIDGALRHSNCLWIVALRSLRSAAR